MKLKLLKVIRNAAFVRIVREAPGLKMEANDPSRPGKTLTTQGVEKLDVTSHEAPLKSFDKAMQALKDVVANILETGQEWKKGVVITSVSISHTKAGTRSVSISFQKEISATEGDHPMDTPMFQIDDAEEGEDGQRRQCSKKHAEQVAEFLDEAESYVKGKRQQQLLPLDDGKSEGAEPTEGDLLDFKKGAAAGEKPADAPAAEPAGKEKKK
jgi:hypothetical protein